MVADFTSAEFEDLGSDRVQVSGVTGNPATDTYKALLAYHAGWAGETRVAFSWPDAQEKAKATAAILAKRVEMAGIEVREWCFEYWGVNALGGPTVPPLAPGVEPPECVLRAAWRCDDERASRARRPGARAARAVGAAGRPHRHGSRAWPGRAPSCSGSGRRWWTSSWSTRA